MHRQLALLLKFALAITLLGGAFSLTGCCGEQTVESQEARYKRDLDKLDLLKVNASKKEKKDIEEKKEEFEKDHGDLTSSGDARIKDLGALCSRIETYESEMNKKLNPVAEVKKDDKNKKDGKKDDKKDDKKDGKKDDKKDKKKDKKK
jgi:hypothetical protein